MAQPFLTHTGGSLGSLPLLMSLNPVAWLSVPHSLLELSPPLSFTPGGTHWAGPC